MSFIIILKAWRKRIFGAETFLEYQFRIGVGTTSTLLFHLLDISNVCGPS